MDILLPKRKNVRLKGYDYSESGYYFVTICTQDKKPILGDIVVLGNDATVGGALPGVPNITCNPGDPWEYSVGMPYTKISKYGKIVLDSFMYINKHF